MKKLALLVVVAACGGGGNHGPGDGSNTDHPDAHSIDAPHDAPTDARIDAPVDARIIIADASLDATPGTCSVLTQTGCATGDKCTWIVDQYTPQYIGHIGCVADGTAAVGAACMFGAAGATGYDDCAKGAVCSTFASAGTPGICKAICDNAGGTPACDATHACETYSKLFAAGVNAHALAGVCDQQCDPLADNDFDGSGSALTRTGTTCGSANIGCY